jgi:hypothetical protein
MDLQADIYSALYDLIMPIRNPISFVFGGFSGMIGIVRIRALVGSGLKMLTNPLSVPLAHMQMLCVPITEIALHCFWIQQRLSAGLLVDHRRVL